MLNKSRMRLYEGVLGKIISKEIKEIYYVDDKHFKNQKVDWKYVERSGFILTIQQLEFRFDNGTNIYFFNKNNNLLISQKDNFPNLNKLNLSNIMDCNKIKNKIISNARFWKLKGGYYRDRPFFRYKETLKKTAILQMALGEKTSIQIGLTAINGDLSNHFFYPSGVLSDHIGLFFNKTIVNRIDFDKYSFRLKALKNY